MHKNLINAIGLTIWIDWWVWGGGAGPHPPLSRPDRSLSPAATMTISAANHRPHLDSGTNGQNLPLMVLVPHPSEQTLLDLGSSARYRYRYRYQVLGTAPLISCQGHDQYTYGLPNVIKSWM